MHFKQGRSICGKEEFGLGFATEIWLKVRALFKCCISSRLSQVLHFPVPYMTISYFDVFRYRKGSLIEHALSCLKPTAQNFALFKNLRFPVSINNIFIVHKLTYFKSLDFSLSIKVKSVWTD